MGESPRVRTKRLSVVYVTYNSTDWIGRSVVSLRAASEAAAIDVDVFVADNASTDDTRDVALAADPTVTFIASDTNRGFAHGANTGFRAAGMVHPILLLNPDVLVSAEALVGVRDAYDSNPAAGLLGCRLVRLDGSLDLAAKRNLPTPTTALVGLVRRVAPFILRSRDDYRATDVPSDADASVSAICGAFMLIRPSALAAVAGFDEAFFMYGEDLDLCKRCRDAGFSIMYVGSVSSVHAKYASIGPANAKNAAMWHRDAMRLYYRKHLARGHSYVARSIVEFGISCVYLARRVRLAARGRSEMRG